MTNTPDEFPGQRTEDSLLLEENAAPPDTPGQLRYDGTSFQLRDSTGTYNPRSGSAQVTIAIFTLDGGLVYDTAGQPLLKVNE